MQVCVACFLFLFFCLAIKKKNSVVSTTQIPSVIFFKKNITKMSFDHVLQVIEEGGIMTYLSCKEAASCRIVCKFTRLAVEQCPFAFERITKGILGWCVSFPRAVSATFCGKITPQDIKSLPVNLRKVYFDHYYDYGSENEEDIINPVMYGLLLQRCPLLAELQLSNNPFRDDVIQTETIEVVSKFQHLTSLKGIVANLPSITLLAAVCPHLKELQIAYYEFAGDVVAHNFPSLTAITLSDTGWIDGSFVLRSLFKNHPFLHRLALPNYRRDNFVELLESDIQNLTSLDVSYSQSVNDSFLQELFLKCPKLKELTLHGCNHISEDMFLLLMERFTPNSVMVWGKEYFHSFPTKSQVKALARYCEKHKVVNCINVVQSLYIDDDGLLSFANVLREKLVVLGCSSNLAAEGLLPCLRGCPNLRHFTTDITLYPEHLIELLKICKHITKLHLRSPLISLDPFMLLCICFRYQNLQEFTLNGHVDFDLIAEHCPNVTYLSFRLKNKADEPRIFQVFKKLTTFINFI